jgi:LAS superfamily LD-carboxypeptidase LdcB
MGLFNNLIGNPLNQKALNQLLARSEQLVNVGTRSDDQIAWMVNNESWIKLTSFIDILPGTPLAAKLNTAAGPELAKKWVLFGGTITEDKSLKYGLDSYSVGYSNPLGQLGYRPMPGITSIDITTLGQLGSLRSVNVKLRANTLEQLDILDTLFFRLGYSCLLEWGHVRYLDSTKYPAVSFDKAASAELVDPFASGLTKEKLLKQIAKQRENSSGNYDGYLGLITNYSYQATPDGGFDCTIKLTGIGSVIDSTKINNVSSFPQSNNLLALKAVVDNDATKQKYGKLAAPSISQTVGIGSIVNSNVGAGPRSATPVAPTTVDVGEIGAYRQFLNGKLFPGSAIEAFLVDLKYTYTKKIQPGETAPTIYPISQEEMAISYFNPGLGLWPAPVQQSNAASEVQDNFIYGFDPSALLITPGTQEATYPPLVDFVTLSQVLVVPMPAPPTGETGDPAVTAGGPMCYIKLGLLLAYLNNSAIAYEFANQTEKRPIIYLNFNQNTNLCYTSPEQFSIDPSICLIPLTPSDAAYGNLLSVNNVGNSITGSLFTPSATSFTSFSGFRTDIGYRGKIMEIFVNVDFLLGIVQSHTTSDGELNAYLSGFLEEVMKGIKKSLGNVNEFNVSYNDDANCITIVDNQVLTEEIKQNQTLNAIPVQGLRSVAKSYSIATETSTKIGSMLAITAQDPRNTPPTLNRDGSAFSQLNNSLVDRLMVRKSTDAGKRADNVPEDNLGVIQLANTFNDFLYQFYQAPVRVLDQLNQPAAANYYLGALNKLKSQASQDQSGNNTSVTANGVMPITVNLTLAGISTIKLYEAFVLPDSVLPSQYKDAKGNPLVAFIIKNLSHTVGVEGWNTTIVGAMMNIPPTLKLGSNVVGQKIPKYSTGAGKGGNLKDICGTNYKNGEVDSLLQELRPDLAAKHKGSLSSDGGRVRLIPAAMRNLEQMLQDASKAGIILKINSAYRTKGDQERVWRDSCSNQIGSGGCVRKPNKQSAATPGYSNHGFGYAVDLASSQGFRINPSKTPKEWRWIQANKQKYSFENLDNSGESHHYNYVGSTPCSRNKPV